MELAVEHVAEEVAGTYQATEAADAPAAVEMSGTMTRRCMDCRTFLGTVPCLAELDGSVTDGVCQGCLAERLKAGSRERGV